MENKTTFFRAQGLRSLRNLILYLLLVMGFIYFYGPAAKFDRGTIETSIQFVYSQF